MKPYQKILLVLASLIGLNCYYGFDPKFTIINIVWCLPIAIEMFKKDGQQ